MKIDINGTHKSITNASTSTLGWAEFNNSLLSEPRNDLVNIDWDVVYDRLGHDIIIHATVKVKETGDALLQLWLQDQHPGIWIPEYRPWVASVVEFEAEQKIEKAMVGLFDSKWRPEDTGKEYNAMLWGYFFHQGVVTSLSEQKKFTYPG